jgi:2-keto-4-pentenoate hydratase/2-oxohepta-3-ene-1,7-dioic acid hydratase in catechol pathway
MKAGDLCEVEIDRIGILRNPVVNEQLSAVSG